MSEVRSITIQNETRINDDIGSAVQAQPAVAIFSNWIFSTWHDYRDGDFDIFFSAGSLPVDWSERSCRKTPALDRCGWGLQAPVS